jgi:tripartite-type tricarboxylate transporter receptor subunit TctC
MNYAAKLCFFLGAFAASLPAASPARGADEVYPARPIKMMVGFSAGSGTDSVARVMAKAMSERLGQPIVIENHAGAGGTIATDMVTKARPDGYTLLTASSSIAISPGVYRNKLPFDTESDLTPIGYIGALPTVLLVNTRTVPVRTLREFIEFVKSKPDTLKFGSSGVGGSTHLFTELFQHITGTRMRHIPYKGGSQDVTALRTGEVDLLFETLILALPILQEPGILPIAITGPQRAGALPNVPTFTEAGLPAFHAEAYFGLLGPARLAPAVVQKLNGALNESLKAPDVVTRLGNSGGLRLTGGTPKEYGERIHTDIGTWSEIVKEAKISSD